MSLAQGSLGDIVKPQNHLCRCYSVKNAGVVYTTRRVSIDDIVLDVEIIGAAESRWEGPFEVPHPVTRAASPVVEIESVGAREIQNAMIHHTKDPATEEDHLVIRG